MEKGTLSFVLEISISTVITENNMGVLQKLKTELSTNIAVLPFSISQDIKTLLSKIIWLPTFFAELNMKST